MLMKASKDTHAQDLYHLKQSQENIVSVLFGFFHLGFFSLKTDFSTKPKVTEPKMDRAFGWSMNINPDTLNH